MGKSDRTRTRLALAMLLALGCASSPSAPMAPDRSKTASPDALGAALDTLAASLRDAEHAVRAAPGFAEGSEIERARGYEFLLRSLIQSLEAELIQDPDYPYFRVLDFWLRGGGDNPDQRYAFSPIRGGEAYRIHGELGSARRVEVQLYAGQPWAASGRSVGYLTFEEIAVDANGAFAIDLVPGAEPKPGQLANPKDATTVFVRHIFDAWDERPTGDVHIDRVGFEGRRRPSATPDQTATRIRAAATNFALRTKTWPAFVAKRYVDARSANALSPLVDTYALGGARGRWMATGHFELPPGKALLVHMPATQATYQGIQLTDLWFDSLEYGNQVSSLNTTQMQAAPDGSFYLVISSADPGCANWLDTGGFERGTFLLRYDGVLGEVPVDRHPTTELVDLEALPGRIPGFAVVDEAERERVRAERRRHLQLRSHR
jgi:hypothetical protein